jgi:hypothetical protein
MSTLKDAENTINSLSKALRMMFPKVLGEQFAWSLRKFGTGRRHKGVIAHIRKELLEVEAETTPEGRLQEWIDVFILSIDGLMRAAHSVNRTPTQTAEIVWSLYEAKMSRNMSREWPKGVDEDTPVEHIKRIERLEEKFIHSPTKPNWPSPQPVEPMPPHMKVWSGADGSWETARPVTAGDEAE